MVEQEPWSVDPATLAKIRFNLSLSVEERYKQHQRAAEALAAQPLVAADDFRDFPTQTGWYRVAWLPKDEPELIHVTVSDPPDDVVFCLYPDETSGRPVTLEERQKFGVSWNPILNPHATLDSEGRNPGD